MKPHLSTKSKVRPAFCFPRSNRLFIGSAATVGAFAWAACFLFLINGCCNNAAIESRVEQANQDWAHRRPEKYVATDDANCRVHAGYMICRYCDDVTGVVLRSRGKLSDGDIAYNSTIASLIAVGELPDWLAVRVVDNTRLVEAYGEMQSTETKMLPCIIGNVSFSASSLPGHVRVLAGGLNLTMVVKEPIEGIQFWQGNDEYKFSFFRIGEVLFGKRPNNC